MRAEIRRHLVVLVVYLGLVSLLEVVNLWGHIDFWGGLILILGWWIGGLVGYGLILLDRLVYAYLLYPEEQLSQQIQYRVGKKDFKGVLELMHRRRGEQKRLAFRSVLFVVAWVVLALFALTSTPGLYAKGLVMGLGLHLAYDFWRDQKSNPEGLNQKLFWQIKRRVGLREQRMFLYVYWGVFLGLTLMLV